MKADKLSITLSIFSLVFAAILYYLSLLDSGIERIEDYPFPFQTEGLNELYLPCCAVKGQIAIWSFILLFLLHIVFYLRVENNNKKWLQRFLQHIIEQNLGGGEYETRITIFGKTKGWKFVCQYIWYALSHDRKMIRLKYCPNLFKDYLVIYNRFSYPEQRKSYTFFRAIHDENLEPQGIAEKCYMTGKPFSAKTVYITDIRLTNDLSQLSSTDQQKIRQYMKATGMNDYDKLCTLKRKPNYIYAVPIRSDHQMWGVISFDNNRNGEALDIEEKLKYLISDYQKIIQFTIQLNK